MYTIKRAAELIGVPASTLRAWQRRYGVVDPPRTDSGYRLYDPADLTVLRQMNELVKDGLTPAVAAQQVIADRSLAPAFTGPRAGSATGGRPPVTHPEGEDDLVSAAASLRIGRVERLLDERFATSSFESVVDRWLMPELQRLGTAWASGEVSVLAEHLVASAIQRRLLGAFGAAGPASSRPEVLTGLPYGAQHELGILAFAVCLRRLGVSVAHLGANLPTPDWLDALHEYDSSAVVLAVPSPGDLPNARETIRELRRAGVRLIAVGGGQQGNLAASEPGVLTLGHELGPAAARLCERITEFARVDR